MGVVKKILGALVAVILVLAFFAWNTGEHCGRGNAGGEVKNPDKGSITAAQYQKMLGVGINVDWMTFAKVKRYYFYWRSKGVNIPLYFKEEGFSNVRIRVGVDVTKNRTALTQLGEIVNDTLKAGLLPIITYTAPELRGNPTDRLAQEHFVRWWETVAEYFKGYPYLLSYDVLIESSGPIKSHQEVLNEVYSQTIQEIRRIDQYRLVFVTPPYTSSPFYLSDLHVTNDGYILAEWHIYASGPKGCTYSESYIEEAISSALNWSRKTGIPTCFGAWRPNYYSKKGKGNGPCPVEVELNFSKAMVSALSKAGIPYDINSDVHFFDITSLAWYRSQEGVLDVILHPRCREP